MVNRRGFKTRRDRGQATVEYILLLAAIASFAVLIAKGLKNLDVAKRLSSPLTKDFHYAYQYGHPNARGYDDGGPKMHPRASQNDDPTNFRIFINPETP